jgi:hypothetical protein
MGSTSKQGSKGIPAADAKGLRLLRDRWVWEGQAMFRRLMGAAFLIAVCAAPALARWPEGVLNDCGVEGAWDEAGWRDLGWAQGGTEGMDFDRAVKRFGKASLRAEGAEGETRMALQLNGNAITAGKQYVLRIWVKTEGPAGAAELRLQPHAEGQPLPFVELGEAARLSGTHDWTLLEIPVPELPEGTVRIYPYLGVTGNGTAWFDEFSLAEAEVEVPLGGQRPITDADFGGVRFSDDAPPTNLIPNGDFEDGMNGWFVENGKPIIRVTGRTTGPHALCYDGYPECAFTTVAVHIRIDPRRAYRLSMRLRTDLRAGMSVVRVIPFKANGEGFGWWFSQDHSMEFLRGRGTQPWHNESVIWREFPPETDFLNVYLELTDAVGSVWFDDVSLLPLSLRRTAEVRGK